MANASSQQIVLEVEARTATGSTECRRMRRGNTSIPGNVYGLDRPPFKVAISPRHLDELLRLGSGVNTVFRLSLAGESGARDAMIKELQRDPLSGLPIHVDFIRIDATKSIHVRVPVRLLGTPTGVKLEGGIIDFVNREVDVECLPTNIPEHLDVDVSELHVNQHVSVGDLGQSEGVKILDDPEQILAVVVAPKVEEEEAAPEDEEVAEGEEPEVAKKGKESAEGEAAESDKG